MSLMNTAVGLITVSLLVYLFVALLKPERFG